MSIRWKLLLSFLAVVIIPSWLLLRYTLEFFDRYTRTALEKEMGAYALTAAQQYRAMVLDVPPRLRAATSRRFGELLAAYGPDILSRLRIITPDGKVRFDSHDDSTVGRNFGGRPEVAKALAGRYGARWELTDDSSYVYYYVAIPIQDRNGNLAGAVLVSRHTGPITRALLQIRAAQTGTLIWAGLAAAAAASLLAVTITRPLRRLTKAARDVARGTSSHIPNTIRGRDEIGMLADSLRRMTNELAERNRYNRDFISETIHELKTPLTSIIGAAELLEAESGMAEESRKRFAGNIRRDARRMNRLVAELAQLTRLDLEVQAAPREEVDYPEFIRAVLARAEQAFEKPRARLTADISEEPIRALIVPGRLEQVIINLLENSFRYTPEQGEVTVTVAPRPEGGCSTSIRDTGPGISPANREKVFERFFTTVPRDSNLPYGSGLGLTIVRNIVKKHGGTVSLSCPEGGGATFTFTLPPLP